MIATPSLGWITSLTLGVVLMTASALSMGGAHDHPAPLAGIQPIDGGTGSSSTGSSSSSQSSSSSNSTGSTTTTTGSDTTNPTTTGSDTTNPTTTGSDTTNPTTTGSDTTNPTTTGSDTTNPTTTGSDTTNPTTTGSDTTNPTTTGSDTTNPTTTGSDTTNPTTTGSDTTNPTTTGSDTTNPTTTGSDTTNPTTTGSDTTTTTGSDSSSSSSSTTCGDCCTDQVTAVLTADPTQGCAPVTVSFDASGSSSTDGDITRYDWDFGDGTTLMDGGAQVSHTYQQGDFTCTVTVTDSCGNTASASQTIHVGEPKKPIQVDSTVPDACQGNWYTASWTAQGGPCGNLSYTWTVTGSVPGLTFSGLNTQTLTLSGYPSQGGDFTVTLNLHIENDYDPPVSDDYGPIDVTIHVEPFTITTTDIPDGCVDQDYGPVAFALSCGEANLWQLGGDVPPGLSLSPTGVLFGTPEQDGDYSITVTATAPDYTTTATSSYTLHIGADIEISADPLPPCILTCQDFALQLYASGGTPPYTWSIESGSLPDGLSLDANSGLISGTPTTAGSYSATISVTDANGITSSDPCGPGPFTLNLTILDPVQITTPATLPITERLSSCTFNLAASGGQAPYTWSLTGSTAAPGLSLPAEVGRPTLQPTLPAGLSLDPMSGTITGTPQVRGWYEFEVQVSDACGSDTQWFDLMVTCSVPVITTTSLPSATVGEDYIAFIQAKGGLKPYTWGVTLPAGLTAETVDDQLVISGQPEMTGPDPDTDLPDEGDLIYNDSGAVPIHVQVTGSACDCSACGTGCLSDDEVLQLSVETGDQDIDNYADPMELPEPPSQLAITTSALPNGTVGEGYDAFIAFNPSTGPYTWTIQGTLPPGLSLSQDGEVSGTPSAPGSFAVIVRIDDGLPDDDPAAQAVEQNYVIAIKTSCDGNNQ